ncbi:hypothetical protein psyc5s11_03290 [Clostridium gelidum]|uniref:NADPH-dependent FMN reductase-like domain-containing protein n=1 Tax=Clostridium gelidum TaxID=704125 RepID=A0ABM7SXD8_9CLOT|nr:flavodoxin family protein [Clostridium gelidum]BCZ44262.1 hypothetical protein psyc5s11_03290 [Clostridium gelidum]
MKEIFVYIGTRTGRESNTFKYISEVLNKTFESVGRENIKVSLYTPHSSKINNCQGCLNCFANGECHQDKNDDMKIIKEKMLSADFVIFASPVYFHNVSGDMKIFIDRISYWSHLLRLSGKAGIAIATSCGNGLEVTVNYIHKVMTHMGIKVVGEFGVIPYNVNEQFSNSIEKCSSIISEYLTSKKIESDNALELLFKANKIAIEAQSELDSPEYRYWNESGLIECNTFEEVLSIMNKK